jgi:hypothetical protein
LDFFNSQVIFNFNYEGFVQEQKSRWDSGWNGKLDKGKGRWRDKFIQKNQGISLD